MDIILLERVAKLGLTHPVAKLEARGLENKEGLGPGVPFEAERLER